MNKWTEHWIALISMDESDSMRLVIRGRSMEPTLKAGDWALVEASSAEDLVVGDLIVVREPSRGFLHRFLGRWRGRLLTKGDGNRHFDPLWGPEAVLGRVVEVRRGAEPVYVRTRERIMIDWMKARSHMLSGGLWRLLRALKGWLLSILLLLVIAVPVWAAVTLTGFEVDAGEDEILLSWETASEVGNLGFYVWRSEDADTGFQKITVEDGAGGEVGPFIPSQDDGFGALYEFSDPQVSPGVVYYYKVQDVPDDGSSGEFSEVKSASVAADPTETPTPTPTFTPTPVPTETPVPDPRVRFWASETELDAGDCATIQWQTENVRSVYFDGEGVGGEGARTFCPCEDETHVLTVYFLEGGAEERSITLETVGTCSDDDADSGASEDDASIDTPTPPPTPTPSPEPESPSTARTPTAPPSPETQPRDLEPTGTPGTARGDEGGGPELGASPTPSASPAASQAGGADGTPSPEPSRVIVEGGDTQDQGAPLSLILGVGALLGLVLIGGGAFLWRQRR